MHMVLRAGALLAVAGALSGGLLIFVTDSPESQLAGASIGKNNMTLSITSSAFESEGKIPSRYTCDDANVNPPLSISNVPDGAKSLVLIVEDPDVPTSIRPDGMWDHWLVFNIPPTTKVILEGVEPSGIAGIGTGGSRGYHGPCPPDREHRYFFKLFALDTTLDLKEGATKQQILNAIHGRVLAETELIGKYARK